MISSGLNGGFAKLANKIEGRILMWAGLTLAFLTILLGLVASGVGTIAIGLITAAEWYLEKQFQPLVKGIYCKLKVARYNIRIFNV